MTDFVELGGEPALAAVIQADRDLVANWFRRRWRTARLIVSGKWDDHPLVQAVALHRIKHSLIGGEHAGS